LEQLKLSGRFNLFTLLKYLTIQSWYITGIIAQTTIFASIGIYFILYKDILFNFPEIQAIVQLIL
jgi:hypothetical protein